MNGESGRAAVYQEFILVAEKLSEEGQSAEGNALTSKLRWQKVREVLSVYALGLMCGPPYFNGVPVVVFIGIPVDCGKYIQLKSWFIDLAARHGLSFVPGDSYLSEFPASASESLLSNKNYRAYLECRIDEQWFKEHHGKWVIFVDGKHVAKAEDEKSILAQLEEKYKGQGAFYHHVLTEAEEERTAICMP